MNNLDNNYTLDETNDIFDLENINLNDDIQKLFEIINDDDIQDEFDKQLKLSNLRNENHKRYFDIDINKIKNLPNDFDDVVEDINNLYNCIISRDLLEDNYEESVNNRKIIDNIYRRINRLDKMVESTLKELHKYNDEKQGKYNLTYFKNIDVSEQTKIELINKYNNLVLYNTVITQDPYEDLKRQIVRKGYINEILKILNLEEENKINQSKQDKLKIINESIELEIKKYQAYIHYLEDLMPEKSKYIKEFEEFKEFYNKIIAYDDTNYNNIKQTYEILRDDTRLKNTINNFEQLFIKEIEDQKVEEKFVYEKFGIKNLKTSLNYISANYIDKMDEQSKKTIDCIYEKLDSDNYELKDLEKSLEIIVKNIWKNSITDIYSFNPNDDYCFICSNNQFIDEKYQTILITKKEINRVNDYDDYQIGFICSYNDNIMYITENDDIMTVVYDDLSNLKTPIQLEQEFINFKVCNRIALNGYKTKIEAVYYINDNNIDKYIKAIELANMYKLPLIELKKQK